MRNYNSYYDRPSPFSFGDTARQLRDIRSERDSFKLKEMAGELARETEEQRNGEK